MKTITIRPFNINDITLVEKGNIELPPVPQFNKPTMIFLKHELAYDFCISKMEKANAIAKRIENRPFESDMEILESAVEALNSLYPHKIAIADKPFVTDKYIELFIKNQVYKQQGIKEPLTIVIPDMNSEETESEKNKTKYTIESLVSELTKGTKDFIMNEAPIIFTDFVNKTETENNNDITSLLKEASTSLKELASQYGKDFDVDTSLSDPLNLFGKEQIDTSEIRKHAKEIIKEALHGNKEKVQETKPEFTATQIKLLDLLTGKLSIPYSLAVEMVVERQYTPKEILNLVTRAYNKGVEDSF